MLEAEHALAVGLRWPTPRSADSLPAVANDPALQRGLDYLATANRWKPNTMRNARMISQVYTAYHDWQHAASILIDAQTLTPHDPIIAWDISLIHEQMGGDMPQAVATSPTSLHQQLLDWQAAGVTADWCFMQGNAAYTANRYMAALTWYHRATLIDPGMKQAWYTLGKINRILGNLSQAEDADRRANLLDPNNRDNWYELGQAYASQKKWTDAIVAYRSGLQATTGHVGMSILYFNIAAIQQFYITPLNAADAWANYEHALSLDDYVSTPSLKAETYNQRGRLLTLQQRWAEALMEDRQALDLEPRSAAYHLSLARVLWHLGQHDQAIATVHQALALDSQSKESYRLLGDFLVQKGMAQQARDMYLHVLQLDPHDQTVQQLIARLK